MFYEITLLSQQSKQMLHWPWIAATRGVGYIPKTRITKIQVVRVCNEIEAFITSESHDPRKRFSLRMSALLISGIIRIIKRQADMLYDEAIHNFKHQLDKGIREMQLLCTPPERDEKSRKKGKKGRHVSDETDVDRVKQTILEERFDPDAPILLSESTEIVQARVEEITLREDDPYQGRREEELRNLGFEDRLEDAVQRPEKSDAVHLSEVAVPKETEEPIVQDKEKESKEKEPKEKEPKEKDKQAKKSKDGEPRKSKEKMDKTPKKKSKEPRTPERALPMEIDLAEVQPVVPPEVVQESSIAQPQEELVVTELPSMEVPPVQPAVEKVPEIEIIANLEVAVPTSALELVVTELPSMEVPPAQPAVEKVPEIQVTADGEATVPASAQKKRSTAKASKDQPIARDLSEVLPIVKKEVIRKLS